ncbi:MAG: hypothetical protein KF754_08380 [Planctomycetes bacterium]|nr:hypothetical protein [Planctomycetota bacterium]
MPDPFTAALSIALEITSPYGAPASFGPGASAADLFALCTDTGDTARRRRAQMQWDFYRGEQLRYLPRQPGENHADFARRPHRHFMNLTRVLVDILSQLYRVPVTRNITGDDRATERIRATLARNPLDLLLLHADRLCRLQGVAAIGASWQDGRCALWPWPAHRLCVVPDPDWPARPLAVVALAAGDGSLAQVWTPDRFASVSHGRVVEEADHGLGRVPFAFVHDRPPVDDFWVEGRGASIVPANAEFNQKLTEMAQTVSLQGFGVMEIVNPDPGQPLVVSPSRAIQFRVAGDQPYGVNFKSPNAPIAGLIADLEFHLRTLLKSQRIPESVLSVHAGTTASGVSILAQNSPVLEDRQERQLAFRALESDLAGLCLTLLRQHEGVSGHAELAVDYPEPSLEQSATERMAVDDWRLRHGLVTPWQLMRRDDPDAFASDEEARAVWQANVRELQVRSRESAVRSNSEGNNHSAGSS